MACASTLNPQSVSENFHFRKAHKSNTAIRREGSKGHPDIVRKRHSTSKSLSFGSSSIIWDDSSSCSYLTGKPHKSLKQPKYDGLLASCLRRIDLKEKGLTLPSGPPKWGFSTKFLVIQTKKSRGELVVARARARPKQQLILGNPSATVEKGKYSYDVETAINKLSSLPPRGSVARCLEGFKKTLSLNDFASIFREFAQRGDWQRAIRLFKYMQRQQWCKPNEHIYTILIGILGRERLLDKCSEIFEEIPAHGVSWNVYSFTALINAYGRNGQYETSLHLLARMKREKIAPSLITYNTVINACAKGGLDWEGLLGLFAQMRHEGIQPDIITYNTLLGACSSRGLSDAAEMVFRTMNEAGIVPDVVTYTYLVETFGKMGLLERVAVLFEEMESAGNLPDVTAYNLLLEAHANCGMIRHAVGVFRQMQEAGCTPNAATYSILLNCYGNSGRYDDVRELFHEMKSGNTQPDVITYNTVIQVFGQGGYFKEVISLFHDMVEENVEPVMETYEGLMFACGMGSLHEDAQQILQHMQRRGIVPSVKAFTGLVEAYGMVAHYEDALVAFNTMKEVGNKPNRDTYNSLIHMYARGGLFLESYAIFRQMHEAGIEKNVETFNGLIEAFGRAGQFDKAIQIFRDMQTAGFIPNQQTQEIVLNVYCTEGLIDEGRAQFLEMKESGVAPSVISYCLMLSLCARWSRWEDAYKLLEEMQTHKMSDTHRVTATMIKGDYDEQPNWQMVEYIFDKFKSEGAGKGMIFYNALLDVLWWFGQKARAAKVLAESRKRGVFPEAFRQTKLIWSVDVHRMSIGAALTSLSVWLLDIQNLAVSRHDIPQLASVVTMQGEIDPSKDAKQLPIAKVVYSFLKDVDAPFNFATWNKGRITCHQAPLKRWLLKSSVNQSVALTNLSFPVSGAWMANTVALEQENANGNRISSQRSKNRRTELTTV